MRDLSRISNLQAMCAAGVLLCLGACTEQVSGSPSDRKPSGPPGTAVAADLPGPSEYGAEWTQARRGGAPPPAVPPGTGAPAAPTAEATTEPATPPAANSEAEAPPAAAAPSAPVYPESPSAPPAAASGAAPAAGAAPSGELALQGRVIQGGLLRGKLDGEAKRVDFPHHRVVIGDGGEVLIGFSRNAPATEKLRITLADGRVLEHLFQVEQRTYEVDRVDGLPDDQVKLDAKTRKAVGQTEAALDKVRRAYTKSDCYNEQFAWPARGKVTSRYGQPRVLNGKADGIHWGVDIAANQGSPVRAPACGKVVFAKNDVALSGNVVVIDHGRGLTSSLLHLQRISVKENDVIEQGDVVGTVGSTGRATGAHLDWRMNLFDVRLDPELIVSQQ